MTATLFPELSDATFSRCQQFRYTLSRSWDTGGTCNFILLNPSTATAEISDPTVTRCLERARRLGFGRMVVTNLFALRATDPKVMLAHPEPVGPDNNEHILEQAKAADLVICGWGKDGRHMNRSRRVKEMLLVLERIKLHCLKLTKDGEPWHPLYLPYDLQPKEWP